ncbi:MAG TPA: TonB-dependent receptor [Flavobacteriaceae bacterium]|nr:TonB-dependent receptor [Flavobacteriaceae bacterium]MCB9212130.1 TonB-dependent receptor [Alteromonas sp.]HPF10491.1 TonB-dependent receptor [Flavobacteriaceae bacterium]HQU22112.1 TonB-dependent receptor [Flavobacteriaceae bacterium]HQU66503.1 TonB-dependent receptor [Flavobacteriaceae bacterium]
MKKILFWGLLLVVHTLYSQTITIIDEDSGEPLDLVTLMSSSPKAFATTNADGQADISAFKDAEIIEIRTLGYATLKKSYAELETLNFQLSMSVSNISMEQVVISATRWSQSSAQIPSKVISISPQIIELQNPQTAADLLGISGKVFIQKSQQGGGSPMIRGFATNRLLYSVDGVRMNTAIFRGGNLQNVISLDPFATERAEVLFGPDAVIYGSDAIGGVMSFQTLVPEFSVDEKTYVSGKAITRYATANNEKTGHFDVNVGWKKWAFVSSITSNDYGDLKQGRFGPDEFLRPFYVKRQDSMDVVVTNEDPRIQTPSGYTQINMMQKVRFKPNEHWDFQYGFHYSETSDYSRYDRQLRTRNGLPRYGAWKYGPQIWMMNNLNIFQNTDGGLYDEMAVRLAIQNFEESRISRNFNDETRETRKERVYAYSGNLDFTKSIGAKNTLFYGLEVVYDDVRSNGIDTNIDTGVDQVGPARYPYASWVSYAAYLSYQFKVSEQFLLQAGIRYNHFTLDAEFDTTFYPFPFETAHLDNGSLTGNLGMVFRPAEDWVLTANAATAFRAPNVDDVGKVFDSEPGSVVVPNPDLEAEYAYNGDVGIAKVFGNSVKVDVSAYYTLLKNALVRRDFKLNGQDSIVYDGELSQVQAIQNAAEARVWGVQAGLEVKLPRGFYFSSDFNYQKGEEELDDGTTSPSRHAAPWFGVSRLGFKTQYLSIQMYVDYSGEVKFEDLPEEEKGKTEIYAINNNGDPYAAGWYTLNFKANYQLTDLISVSGGLENITDRRYRPYSSGISGAGRNFILSLRANF